MYFNLISLSTVSKFPKKTINLDLISKFSAIVFFYIRTLLNVYMVDLCCLDPGSHLVILIDKKMIGASLFS